MNATTFGPSALLTPANALTLARLLTAPVLVALIVETGPSTWLLAAIWFVAAGSDGIDGYVARRMGATRSGAFLDPLADKFLVLGALGALADVGVFMWLPVVLIAFREVAMSVFRSVAGRRGVSIPARSTAKLKTLLQDLAIFLALIPTIGLHHVALVRDVLWVAVALTIYTGLEYARDGRKVMANAQTTGVAPVATEPIAGGPTVAGGPPVNAG